MRPAHERALLAIGRIAGILDNLHEGWTDEAHALDRIQEIVGEWERETETAETTH